MRRRPRSRSWLPPAGVVALVALLALDVALVMRAFDHVDASPPPAGRPADSAPAPSSTATRPESATTPAPSATTPVGADGPTLLTLAADGTVLRATSGSCAEDASPGLEVRDPEGQARTLDLPDDVAGVLGLDASTPDAVVLVGTDRECRPQAWTGGVDDGRWTSTTLDDHWFLTASDAPEVHAPGGRIDVPCRPANLSTLNAVRLLCETGTILGTSDDGGSWVPLGSVDATAVAYDGPSRGVALAARRDCPVAVLTTDNGGAGWDRTACLDGAEAGAVAVRADLVAAVVDDVLWRSEDAGATWERLG